MPKFLSRRAPSRTQLTLTALEERATPTGLDAGPGVTVIGNPYQSVVVQLIDPSAQNEILVNGDYKLS